MRRSSMMAVSQKRFDGPFWLALAVGALLAAALGCFGLAAVAQSFGETSAAVIAVAD
jgi:hypothetical protein